ncbi:MAG: glycoside hydrolase family 5 protein [Bacteroidales bacterium]|nr:glycoside hydrolase family 5 protein [Bacteroidales bacterium]
MKTIITIMVTASMMLVSCGDNAPVKENGQLSVSGIHLINQYGDTVMLHGVSYGWHNWWPRFYNEGTVTELTEDWGINVIRAAMGVEPDDGYLKSPEWSREKVETIVDAAIKNDIYVIIDWHAHGIHTEEAAEFFSEIARKYGAYPHVIYEIFNEPVRDSWDTIKQYSIEVIRAIREHDPDNIILVGSPYWDQDLHIVADDPIEGFDNLMYALHFYAATHGESLRDRGDYAMSKGIPLFISESAGMEASGDGPIDYEAWSRWINWMKEHKISWVTWSISDKDETCSMLKESAGSEGGWTKEDLKESGIKTRELMREMGDKE